MSSATAPGPPDPGSPGAQGGEEVSGGGSSPPTSIIREQDRFLPIANIARIMKRALPQNAKIAKDAKETMQECVSEFVSFITSEYVAFFFKAIQPNKLYSKISHLHVRKTL